MESTVARVCRIVRLAMAGSSGRRTHLNRLVEKSFARPHATQLS